MEISPNIKPIISDYLSGFLGEERYNIITNVLQNRTRYLTVCLEYIYQAQNASAVLRSAEAFGLQDIHIIEANNSYNVNPDVVRGSDKWLTLHRYNNCENPTQSAIDYLKKNGYRIVATSPHVNDVALSNYDITKGKVALFFGNEHNGVSNLVLDQADDFLYIPMYGFTESFNISVAAGMSIYVLREKLNSSSISWKLSDEEFESLRFRWLRKAVKRSDLTIKRFLEDNPHLK